jgi:hypothetical protein
VWLFVVIYGSAVISMNSKLLVVNWLEVWADHPVIVDGDIERPEDSLGFVLAPEPVSPSLSVRAWYN